MNLYKLNVINKNINLYSALYILFIRNQRKTTKKLITEKIPFPTVFIPSPYSSFIVTIHRSSFVHSPYSSFIVSIRRSSFVHSPYSSFIVRSQSLFIVHRSFIVSIHRSFIRLFIVHRLFIVPIHRSPLLFIVTIHRCYSSLLLFIIVIIHLSLLFIDHPITQIFNCSFIILSSSHKTCQTNIPVIRTPVTVIFLPVRTFYLVTHPRFLQVEHT
jgi:hypothetical protein